MRAVVHAGPEVFVSNSVMLEPGVAALLSDAQYASLPQAIVDALVSDEDLSGGGGGGTGGLTLLRSDVDGPGRLLTFADSVALAAGIAFTDTLPIGTFIYNGGIFVPAAFDGTTPGVDIGMFQDNDVTGLAADTQGDFSSWNLWSPDNNNGSMAGIVAAQNSDLRRLVAAGVAYSPWRVTVAGPLYVVASQDSGGKGGIPLDSTAGELIAWALVSIPA